MTGEYLIAATAEALFVYVVELEERRVDTGVRVHVGGCEVGPSGLTWKMLCPREQEKFARFVADELAGGVPEPRPRQLIVGEAFVVATSRALCPDAQARKSAGRQWLHARPVRP